MFKILSLATIFSLLSVVNALELRVIEDVGDAKVEKYVIAPENPTIAQIKESIREQLLLEKNHPNSIIEMNVYFFINTGKFIQLNDVSKKISEIPGLDFTKGKIHYTLRITPKLNEDKLNEILSRPLVNKLIRGKDTTNAKKYIRVGCAVKQFLKNKEIPNYQSIVEAVLYKLNQPPFNGGYGIGKDAKNNIVYYFTNDELNQIKQISGLEELDFISIRDGTMGCNELEHYIAAAITFY